MMASQVFRVSTKLFYRSTLVKAVTHSILPQNFYEQFVLVSPGVLRSRRTPQMNLQRLGHEGRIMIWDLYVRRGGEPCDSRQNLRTLRLTLPPPST